VFALTDFKLAMQNTVQNSINRKSHNKEIAAKKLQL
jgi:hypothetical protein